MLGVLMKLNIGGPASVRLWFLLPAALLLVALLPLPYGYYNFLRWVVMLAGGIAAYAFYRSRNRVDVFVVVSALVAVAFNPIVPVILNKGLWSVIDVAVAAWFAFIAIWRNQVATSFTNTERLG